MLALINLEKLSKKTILLFNYIYSIYVVSILPRKPCKNVSLKRSNILY